MSIQQRFIHPYSSPGPLSLHLPPIRATLPRLLLLTPASTSLQDQVTLPSAPTFRSAPQTEDATPTTPLLDEAGADAIRLPSMVVGVK